ncbi:MAG: hypothetical protein HYX84_07530 [Chloroflexi bacterium]|nr:hypothetical protein [Chloroflexota bacterium]
MLGTRKILLIAAIVLAFAAGVIIGTPLLGTAFAGISTPPRGTVPIMGAPPTDVQHAQCAIVMEDVDHESMYEECDAVMGDMDHQSMHGTGGMMGNGGMQDMMGNGGMMGGGTGRGMMGW